ncbi:MAG: NADP-dependent oxidoreductase [Pseudomonadota bacterium]|nr:NADP-dependent oxidoreductase [Pseudomonadota bacterium]
MATESRRIVLARHCRGLPQPDDFRIEGFDCPDLKDGQVLVRNILLSVDPGTRARLSGKASYVPPLPLGGVVGAFSAGEVIESRSDKLPVGSVVTLADGWSEHAVLTVGRGFMRRIGDRRLPLRAWLGVLGVSGMTAWFGLNRVGEMKAGETVVVTSAAGAVGSAAAQIARVAGCRVIGVAGGPEKCAWLTGVARLDAAVDYKAVPDIGAALKDLAPKGVDILFDNVGNAMIDTVIPLMNVNGRIVVSGQMDAYNRDDEPGPGLVNTRAFITHRLKMQGLVVFDDLPQWGAAEAAMADHLVAGEIAWRDEVIDGLEATPAAFAGLFTGQNRGRRMIRLCPDPAGFPE